MSGYYVGYQRDLYPPEEVDMSSMTHLMVGRIEPRSDGTLATHFDIDDVNGPAMARDLASRAHDAGVVPVLMVGGAGVHTWSEAASDAHRADLVTNLVATMDDYGFDGLDLDWVAIAEEDRPSLRALAEDLREASPGIVLTIPLGWVNANFPAVDPFFAEIAPLFDQVNLMTYSMAGPWSGWQSWHTSALAGETSTTPSSVRSSIEAYVDAGIDPARLGIGLGFYGGCWTGVDGPNQEGGSEAGLGGAIIWTINQGYIATNPAGERNPPLEAARDAILLTE